MNKLKSIEAVEIFSIGKWNGDEYTEADLDEMVRAFSETADRSRPALKLGHDENQELLQRDGLPAAGWVGKLYRSGSKLLADFIDIPNKIYELIKNKAYRNVSSEIYWDVEFNGVSYRRALAGVALLGADMPAVTNLSDLLAMYGLEWPEKKRYNGTLKGAKLKEYTMPRIASAPESKEGIKMSDENKDGISKEQFDELTAKIAKFQTGLEDANKVVESLKSENDALKTFKIDAEVRAANLECERFLDALTNEGWISKSMREPVRELRGPDKKEYSLGEKKMPKDELIRHIFALAKEFSKVNTKETSFEGTRQKANDEELAKEISKYATDNKVKYSEAYRAVLRGKV